MFRLIGAVVLLGSGVILWGSSWFAWSEPLIVRSEKERARGVTLFEKLNDRKNPPAPLESFTLRKEIMELAGNAAADLPLDGRLYRLNALASVPISFESEKTATNFAIDRMLIPFSVNVPMIHAAVSLYYDDEEVVRGWKEALKRAKAADRMGGSESRFEERVLKEIAYRVRKDPRLQDLAGRSGAP